MLRSRLRNAVVTDLSLRSGAQGWRPYRSERGWALCSGVRDWNPYRSERDSDQHSRKHSSRAREGSALVPPGYSADHTPGWANAVRTAAGCVRTPLPLPHMPETGIAVGAVGQAKPHDSLPVAHTWRQGQGYVVDRCSQENRSGTRLGNHRGRTCQSGFVVLAMDRVTVLLKRRPCLQTPRFPSRSRCGSACPSRRRPSFLA
jgi:hypothetical protein